MGNRKYHWPTIKAEYVEGVVDGEGNRAWVSLEELAKKYGMAPPSMRRKSSQEGWLQERYAFVTKVEQARLEKKTDKLAGESAQFDIKCLKVAQAGISHIAHHMKEAAEKKKALTLAESNLAAQALKSFQQVGRLALGESTEKTDNSAPIINLNLTKVDVSN
jgi:hypothetical protein